MPKKPCESAQKPTILGFASVPLGQYEEKGFTGGLIGLKAKVAILPEQVFRVFFSSCWTAGYPVIKGNQNWQFHFIKMCKSEKHLSKIVSKI